jgi:hypothetical protein
VKKISPEGWGLMAIFATATVVLLGLAFRGISSHDAPEPTTTQHGVVIAVKNSGDHCTLQLKPSTKGAKKYWTKRSYQGICGGVTPPAAAKAAFSPAPALKYSLQPNATLQREQYVKYVGVKRKGGLPPGMAWSPQHACQMTANPAKPTAHPIYPSATDCNAYKRSPTGVTVTVIKMSDWVASAPPPPKK